MSTLKGSSPPVGFMRKRSPKSFGTHRGVVSVVEILPKPVRDDLDLCKSFFQESLLSIDDVETGAVAEKLRDILRVAVKPPILRSDLAHTMARHLVQMEGKWFRAGLAILSGRLFGVRGEMSIPVGAALEMIHLASLIHDDIIDGGDQRRGQASLPFLRGPAVSVLMGDLLHAKAMRILSGIGKDEIVVRVAEAVYQVCLGEISQHQFSKETPPTESEYLQIIRKKTGALLGAAAITGPVLGGKSDVIVSTLRDFGINLGVAFQISDDILDVTAPEEEVGKTIGADLRNGHITLPLIHAFETGGNGPLAGRAVGESAMAMPILVEWLETTGSLDYAWETARRFIERAKDVLRSMPVTPEMNVAMLEPLASLADYVVERM